MLLFQEREELLALLDGGDQDDDDAEANEVARPRQRMSSRMLDSLSEGSTVRISRSRPASKSRTSFGAGVKKSLDKVKKERRKLYKS